MTPQEQIHFIVGPQVAIGSTWFDRMQVERGKVHGAACPDVAPTGGDAWTEFINLHYYDLALAEYVAYVRTGDPVFLDHFMKCADVWWQLPSWIGSGTTRKWPDEIAPPPRHAALAGLILRALKGRSEMWDWMADYSRGAFNAYVKRRATPDHAGEYKEPLYDLREGAFALRHYVWLSQCLPDSFPLTAGGIATNGAQIRAEFLAEAENAAVSYFGRTQRVDGAWVWNDAYLMDDGGSLQGITQPFMVGMLLAALIDLHAVTTKPEVRTSIQNQVTKACRYLYSGGPYTRQRLVALSAALKKDVFLRGFHYFYGGGTTVNPTRYEKGDLPADWNPTDAGDVQNQRQPIGLLVAPYGWCFKQTGDPFFKQAGDDLWDAAYGETDGIRNYMAGGKGKDYNQNCSFAPSYLAYVGGSVSQPLPQPIPEPIPTQPTPLPSQPTTPTPPAPSPTGSTVTDSKGGVWTIGPNKETLRDGVQMGGGQGTEYRYVDQFVYVLGMDKNWWKWSGASWSNAGATEPGTVTQPAPQPAPQPPAPAPQPLPNPVPTPPRVLRWPIGKADQALLWQSQAKEGFRPNAFVARPAGQPKGDYVEFVRF